MREESYFKVKTPLDIEIRTTYSYWEYLITIKHPIMKGKEEIVKSTLESPDEIRQSKIDNNVFLYYKKFDRLYCVVAKHFKNEGFLITAYPTDKVKEGEQIWVK
ncbi:hypothetical protein [Thermodesulfovibrio yellowstonii]|uniref:DUF4258 domain-containing protein n=1 Tax=Thermodesulfovibrio yellowstonii TaxID=28262 RepID=A0A9W6LK04_9BACT|nr:hypothetical protein [Thermodesulfovibrio islandicus]GLI53746.1 hypothetical protein TISLANDTSLP1_14390 [Thermodesulfovibrio islandicus]